MSEARTDTIRTRPPTADAHRAEAGGSGKHRGKLSVDGAALPPRGRHRRLPSEGGGEAAA
ncbi:hypothetical protein ABZ371_32460 [Streptomyces sp. NPDC005899]|uniref:hypothetical protein n=1 Tax=Streptomyces sp. NPDC005899 TaxID=3155716 RepID=UPI0033D3DBCB